MPGPSDAEIAALAEAGLLLRFAAEHVANLDPDLSLAIAEATDAKAHGNWTPAVSQKFWAAFGTPCDLIKPVTLDCIATQRFVSQQRNWLTPWRAPRKTSLAARTSSRYTGWLSALMLIALLVQFYAWMLTSLSKDLDGFATGPDMVRTAQLLETSPRVR